MKILFLDFDGVLNNEDLFANLQKKRLSDDNWASIRWESMIDPSKVDLLNEIIEETNCKIVVSSSWRIANSLENLQKFLNKNGFKFILMDKTPTKMSNHHHRGNEIRWWFERAEESGLKIGSFIILDDNSDMGEFLPRLVKTSWKEGLTQELATKAKELLSIPVDWKNFKRS